MTAFEVAKNTDRFGIHVIGFMDPKLFRPTVSEAAEPRVEQRPVSEQLADIAIKGAQDYEIPDAIDG